MLKTRKILTCIQIMFTQVFCFVF